MTELPTLTEHDPDAPRCRLCGEQADEEMGEFWCETTGRSLLAHARCGADAGLTLA